LGGSSFHLAAVGPLLSLNSLAAAILLINQFDSLHYPFLPKLGVMCLAGSLLLHGIQRGSYVKAEEEETKKLIDCNHKNILTVKIIASTLIIGRAATPNLMCGSPLRQ